MPLARMNRSTDAYTYAAQLEQPSLVVCGGVLTEWRLRLTTSKSGSAARWQLYNGRMVEAWHLRQCCGPPVALVSDWKPRGLWSAESSFKSALLQQHMSVLQYLHCSGSTPCSGVVAASGVVPCYDETQAQCVTSMPQARQCCSRSVGFAVWGMGVMVNASEAILIIVQVEILPA